LVAELTKQKDRNRVFIQKNGFSLQLASHRSW
jgi:hypothetical protein